MNTYSPFLCMVDNTMLFVHVKEFVFE